MAEHEVQQGECMESIAEKHGFFWETLWNHSENAELKDLRQDPNVLLPGDVVQIPEKTEKEEDCATGELHRFLRKGVPAVLRLRLLRGGAPRAGVPFVLEVDGQSYSGTTDDEGRLEHSIPPNAMEGKLIVGEGEEQEEYPLELGAVDPIDEMTGVQARLNNLGYACGEVDGTLNDTTREALEKFQSKHGLEVTGEADDQTRAKLQVEHKY